MNKIIYTNIKNFTFYKIIVNLKKDKDEEDEVLGYEAIYVGQAIMQKKGDPASAVITSVDREVLTGDRLIPNSDQKVNIEFKDFSFKFSSKVPPGICNSTCASDSL